MRALFLTAYPLNAAATRYRFHQYFPYLRQMGVQCTLRPSMSNRQFGELYIRSGAPRKAVELLTIAARDTLLSLRARQFDVVVIQRSALLFGPPLVEWIIARLLKVPVVFDFDDAIWLEFSGSTWGSLAAKLKCPGKTSQIVRMAQHVVVCNEYTRDYALQFRSPEDVTVVPTVVDAEQFTPRDFSADATEREPVIGWIGTHTTAPYLEMIAAPLAAAAARHPYRLKVVGAGSELNLPGVKVEYKKWRLDEEVADYQGLDIGLYPVKDDEWGRGKTGFKPVVYMACGVPCICSPVGGVVEFMQHNQNGMLASSETEWLQSLTTLLTNIKERRRIGEAGRRTVEEEYSMQAQAPRFGRVIQSAARAAARG